MLAVHLLDTSRGLGSVDAHARHQERTLARGAKDLVRPRVTPISRLGNTNDWASTTELVEEMGTEAGSAVTAEPDIPIDHYDADRTLKAGKQFKQERQFSEKELPGLIVSRRFWTME